MSATVLNWMSVLCYLVSGSGYMGFLTLRKPNLGRLGTGFLALGLIVHFVALMQRASLIGSVPYSDLYGSISLFAWDLGLVYLGLELYLRQKSMSIFLLPLVIVLQAAFALFQRVPIEVDPWVKGWLFAVHVNISVLAYAAFAISFIASVAYLTQHWRLRTHRPGRWFSLLPSLDLLERVNLTSVILGVGALSVGILTGVAWARRAWSHASYRWDAKITWSLLVLAIYAFYIILQKRRGWRGQRSAWVAVGGFLAVLFSYTMVNLFFSRLHAYF